MDYTKNVLILILISAMLMPTVAATDLDYTSSRIVGLGILIEDGNTQEVYARANNPIEPKKLIFEIIPYYGSSLPSTNITLICAGTNTTTNTYNLDDFDSWSLDGVVYLDIPTIDPYSLDIRPSTYNTNATAEGGNCVFTPEGQDLFVTTYLLPLDEVEQSLISENYDFSTPSPALSNMVGTNSETGIRGLLNSGFMLLDLMIMIMAVIFFVTIILIIYKVLQYFASRPGAIQ